MKKLLLAYVVSLALSLQAQQYTYEGLKDTTPKEIQVLQKKIETIKSKWPESQKIKKLQQQLQKINEDYNEKRKKLEQQELAEKKPVEKQIINLVDQIEKKEQGNKQIQQLQKQIEQKKQQSTGDDLYHTT